MTATFLILEHGHVVQARLVLSVHLLLKASGACHSVFRWHLRKNLSPCYSNLSTETLRGIKASQTTMVTMCTVCLRRASLGASPGGCKFAVCGGRGLLQGSALVRFKCLDGATTAPAEETSMELKFRRDFSGE